MTFAARFEDSTKYTFAAPRLSASIPTAPVPAYKSTHTEPASRSGFPAVNTLKRVSRRRSDVGRIPIPGNERIGLLRNFPAMTRISFLADDICRAALQRAARDGCFRICPGTLLLYP